MYFDKDNIDIKTLNFRNLESTCHLSLSEGQYLLLDGGDTINQDYFSTVYKNAINIFEDLFWSSDFINLVHVVYTYNKPYKKTNMIKKFTTLSLEELFYFKEYRKVDDNDVLCDEFTYHCFVSNIKYKRLLKAISNQDFKGLIPNIKQDYNYSEIYIINNTKNLIYHLYDDRGLWLAFNKDEDFSRYCKKYSHLIFDIDNEEI